MSTQNAQSIRLTHTSPQRAFRLIELNPEILELISSKNAPTLYLKSPPTEINNNTATGQDSANNTAFVNLCTPTDTYRIRQVQSSNSIHVIRPSHSQSDFLPLTTTATVKERQNNGNGGDQGRADEYNEEDPMHSFEEAAESSVTAIAKCGSTLELHPLTAEESLFAAKQMLSRVLPVWDHLQSSSSVYANGTDDGDVEMVGAGNNDYRNTTNRAVIMKETVFTDLPFATSHCQAAWLESCAFVHDDMAGKAFRPSARVKLELWKRVLEGCVLHSIDLEKQFLVQDLWKAVLGEDDADDGSKATESFLSRALFHAVVRRVAERTGGSIDTDSELKWSNLDKNACIKWVGETYLEATAPNERFPIGRSELLNAWKDLLPEAWRNEVSLSMLPETSYKHPDPVSICFVHESDRDKLKRETKDSGSSSGKAKNSRNWHERFKSQRK